MKRFTLLFYLILALLSCGKKQSRLYIVFSYKPLTYLPNIKSELITSSILMNFYDPLIRFDVDLRPRPGLAEYWENIDGTTWIFHLRKGVKFISGKTFTSEDVYYTFYRIIHDTKSSYRSILSSIDTIFTPDSYTVIFKLKSPCSNYLEKISQILILQNNCPDSLLSTYSCGTGPLKHIKTTEDGTIYAKPNNYYFGEKVKFDQVIFTSNTLEIPLKKKNLKNRTYFLYTFPPKERFKSKDNFIRIPGPLNSIRYIGLNLKKKPFDNKSFRKAMYLSLCRAKIADSIRKIYGNPVIPAYELALPTQIGFLFYKPSDCQDKDSIQKLLLNAKYDGRPLTLLVSTTKLPYAKLIQKNFNRVGINLQLEPLEPHEIFSRVTERRDFSLFLLALVSQSIDIYTTSESYFHTAKISNALGVRNYFGFSNRHLDSLIQYSDHSTKRKRKEIMQEIESILINEIPIIPLLYEGNNFYVSSGLQFKPRIDRLIIVNEIKTNK